MPDVSTRTEHVTSAVSPGDPWPKLKEALGVTTQQEVAERAGVDLRTAQRLFERPERVMGTALRLREVSGIGLDELFPVDSREAA